MSPSSTAPQVRRAHRCPSCRALLDHNVTVEHRGTETEMWRCSSCSHIEARCQCGAKIYELVDGKVAVAVGSAKARRLRMVVEQESGLIECRCRRVHRL